MLTLHHAPTSVCSQKVRVAMALMNLDYDSRVLDLQKGDQFAPEYMALNRNAVVPTLVDDGLVVIESSIIIDYLDRTYNAGALTPADRAGQVGAQLWLLRCLAIHQAINSLTFSTAMRARILATQTPDQIAASIARMPDPVAALKRRDLLDHGVQSVHLRQALMHLRQVFSDMQAALAGAPWMGGAGIGIVDVALIAYVDRLDRLGLSGLWQTEFPRVQSWLDGWKGTAAYATGIQGHTPPGTAEAMRAAGAALWPQIRELWTSN